MIRGARMEETEAGRVAVEDGWFVINVRDAAWVESDTFGAACVFEDDRAPFADLGFTLCVLSPGQPSALYHRESNQEDFLVLSGECTLLIEGEERSLRAWDFVHCPPETEHIFVGAGDGPCLVFMTGGRTREKQVTYPRSELALRHGAGVEVETSSPTEAYTPFRRWLPGRPDMTGLPWA